MVYTDIKHKNKYTNKYFVNDLKHDVSTISYWTFIVNPMRVKIEIFCYIYVLKSLEHKLICGYIIFWKSKRNILCYDYGIPTMYLYK